ncbi:MAG TPA: signal peptidase I [Longimicrobiales bacterium]
MKSAAVARVAWDWTKSIVIGFAIFLVLRAFLLQTWVITSGSMEGTLMVGDLLILNKVAYGAPVPGTQKRLPGYTEPRRGDVVVFRAQHDTLDVIKRLIGLPGDTLSMKDGDLYLNGRKQVEPYVRHISPNSDGTHPWMEWQFRYLTSDVAKDEYRPTRDNWGPIVVPAGHYFLLGDNRDESLDSRFWGFLDPARVKGKATLVYYSYERDSLKPFPWLHVRWDRIGDRIR